jgi:hypothetical protein
MPVHGVPPIGTGWVPAATSGWRCARTSASPHADTRTGQRFGVSAATSRSDFPVRFRERPRSCPEIWAAQPSMPSRCVEYSGASASAKQGESAAAMDQHTVAARHDAVCDLNDDGSPCSPRYGAASDGRLPLCRGVSRRRPMSRSIDRPRQDQEIRSGLPAGVPAEAAPGTHAEYAAIRLCAVGLPPHPIRGCRRRGHFAGRTVHAW